MIRPVKNGSGCPAVRSRRRLRACRSNNSGGLDVTPPLVPMFASVDKHMMQPNLYLARPMLDYVLPPRCPGCGTVVETDHRFCAACWVQLDFLTGTGCARCSIPLDPFHGKASQSGDEMGDALTCGPCLAAPPSFDGVVAAVAYGEVARRVALRLKYGRRTGLARTIATILSPRLVPQPALFVPVPLHRWRMWSRGFNQSHAIGTALARTQGNVCRPDILIRTKATPALRGMNPAERRQTVRSAFAVTTPLEGQTIYLVDDVFTTGATANACARVLKKAGAGRVTLVCWARVLRDD